MYMAVSLRGQGKVVSTEVKPELREVIVTIRTIYGLRNIVGVGVAKCHPEDTFNANLGAIIALHRALGYKVPTEFIEATTRPQSMGIPKPGLSTFTQEVTPDDLDAIADEFDCDADKMATALIQLRRYVNSVIAMRG
jgi:hypothetical protein